MAETDYFSVLRTATAEALGVDEAEVTRTTTLFGDLGAESIDLLDILFRFERKTGLKIRAADISAYVSGGIPPAEFVDAERIVTPKGLAQLKRAMPQIDEQALVGRLDSDRIMTLFSYENLVSLIEERAPSGVH